LINRDTNVEVNSLYYCPSHPEGKIEVFRKSCYCRKPMAGLFEEAKRDSEAVLPNSLFVGDKESDRRAAENLSMPYLMYQRNAIENDIISWIRKGRNYGGL
jgi:D-glycero-D-manno-heptose 1,7-bisphosphate phosphatase